MIEKLSPVNEQECRGIQIQKVKVIAGDHRLGVNDRREIEDNHEGYGGDSFQIPEEKRHRRHSEAYSVDHRKLYEDQNGDTVKISEEK